MSTSVIERLDSLVTKDPLPCEVYLVREKRFCGKPSAYRIHRECQCGAKSTRHLCEKCYFDLMTEGVHCHFCLTRVTDWRLI